MDRGRFILRLVDEKVDLPAPSKNGDSGIRGEGVKDVVRDHGVLPARVTLGAGGRRGLLRRALPLSYPAQGRRGTRNPSRSRFQESSLARPTYAGRRDGLCGSAGSVPDE